MDFIRRLFRPPVLITAGSVATAGTALIVTRLFGLSLVFAVLLVLTIVLVVVIVILVRQLRAARAAEEIEKTISRQADRDIEKSVPGKAGEVENMKAELLAALERLKSSRLGKRRGQAALSVLPWYMLVGPAGAGKSVLVGRSGLHFPLLDEQRQPKSVRGVGGTRSFEWWLSEEAVILDMAGRTLGSAQFEDTDDWIDFLEVLKNQRKRKALNGVLVAVSMEQVAGRPEAQVDSTARSVRERVQELIHHLGVVFPVYVVFTHCDRLAGFAEFFAELPREQRGQVWGATVGLDRSREESAERVFDAELDHLLSALSDRRMARLADIPDAVQRARAFAFPLQLERARAGMRKFVEALFEPDPVEEGPLFRGFYLTSAKQEGAPVDRVLQPIASGLGAGSAAWPAAPQVGNGAFFVRDFLTQVVFPDAELATASTRAEARKRRSRVFLFLGLGIALLTFVILLGALSAANGRLINRMRRASRDVAEQVRADAPPMQNLALLEDLRASAVVVDSLARRKPFWRWVSAYSGDALRDPAVQLYVEKSLESLVAPSAREMEATLTRMTDTGDGSFIRYYFLFRAWRLLTEPKQLKLEDAPILAREMRRVIEPRLAYASPSDRQRFPRLLSSQVEFLATHSNWLARLAPAYYRLGNPDLVARATARVRNTWDSGQFYRLMIDETQPQVKPVGLASLVSNPGFLNGSFEVPGLFTREGWQRQIKPQIEWYRVQMQRDWVVADAFRGRPPDLADSLLGYYARDYSANWVRFLTGLGVADPRDMKGAVEMMGAAAQDDSPILKVLHGVADQTSLGADPSSPLSRAQGDFEIVRDFFEAPEAGGGAKRVTSFIARFLQNLKGGSRNALDQSKPPSAHYLDELRDAHKEVLKAAQPDAPASDIKNLMTFGTESSNPVKSALSWVDGLAETYASSPATEPVARLLKLPITGTQQAAKGGLRPELANKWNFLVVQPFQRTLAGKYPLVENGADAALFDFQEFFRPGGTFWSFYEAELKDYVLEDGTSRNPDGSVPFSADFMACLRRAYDLRESFFAGGASAPALKFSVRPNSPEGPALIRMVSLDLGGQYAPYTMGVQQWLPLEWPGTDANAGATLRAQVSSGQQPESLTWPGVWGLFHLLDHAQFGQVEGPTPSATWKLSYGAGRISVTYDIQPSSAAHHPFRPGFLRFALPASP